MKPLGIFAALVLSASTAFSAEDVPEVHRHIAPILYQLGCSAGNCHGAFAGKGGFRLSLFAGSAEFDYQNIKSAFGRRIDVQHPEKSLLLLKPTARVPHEGGMKLRVDDFRYGILKRWIEAGTPYFPEKEAKVLSVRVEPPSFALASQETKSVKVIAKLSTGKEEDVTRLCRFESLNPGLAEVDALGTVVGKRPGSVAVLAHYAGQVGFSTALMANDQDAGKSPTIAKNETPADPVDRALLDRLNRLKITPSPRCDDLEFLRRVHLDTIGQLPTPDEIRAFQADAQPDKRSRTIERLLAHPLHAALWAGKMCDMLGADDRFIADGVYKFHDWLRNKFEANTPWDKLAHGVICATMADGRTVDEIQADQKREAEERKKNKDKKDAKPMLPAGKQLWHVDYATRNTLEIFYSNLIHTQDLPGKGRVVDSKKVALRVARTFLGVQLECAQCHKHPNDQWSQADFLSFAQVFAYVDLGADPRLLAKKVNVRGPHAAAKPVEQFIDPDTQASLPPRILGGKEIVVKDGSDPREDLWRWMTSKENPYFARAIVNRVWSHYLGRGFIEPSDGQAAANPPTHPEVLQMLADDFIATGFDLRKLHRRIVNTLAYQRDWRTNPSNARDDRHFSHRTLRRMTAEQALDALAQATDSPIKLPKRFGTPRDGQKAVEVALSRVGGDDGYVLTVFGRPIRVQNCDCERSASASLSQTLYLFNDEKLLEKLHAEKGRLSQLEKKISDDRKLLEELYLWTLTRFPTEGEITRSLEHVRQSPSRVIGFQDLFWSLINRHDFVINH